MNNSLLSVNQLTSYRDECLLFSGISFQLQAGELLQIIGINGSGKTTLLRMLTGLYPLQIGEINWCGRSISTYREIYHQQIFYVGHSLGIKNELTVLENLQFNWRKFEEVAAVDILTKLELIRYRHKLCRHLSRGQRQRVVLARLLLAKATLWILDEPFASLDQGAVDLLQQIFAEHLQTKGAIIFTSHQPLTLATLSPKMITV